MAPVHYQQGAFPPDGRLKWEKLAPLQEKASHALGRYAGALDAIPNKSVLLSPLIREEAVLSSRIEGTQASVEDVMRYEAGQEPASKRQEDDIQEIVNYRRALQQAQELLENQPLSNQVLLEVHSTLLAGARGVNATPGSFRVGQNWIGPKDCLIVDATFIPVHPDRLLRYMDTLVNYALQDVTIPLMKIALLHAEFEAIHPFSDGNGRLGRILIPLMMWRYGLIPGPMFYISAWLEANRDEYYDRLLAVSSHDDWTGWCLFFFQAVESQANNNLKQVRAVMSLYSDMKDRIPKLSRSQYGINVLDWVFRRPIFTTSDLLADSGIPGSAARRILSRFEDSGILAEIIPGRGQNPSLYVFTDLLEIAGGRD